MHNKVYMSPLQEPLLISNVKQVQKTVLCVCKIRRYP